MASSGWAVLIGVVFSLMKLENVYSNILAVESYFGWHYTRSKVLCLEK